MKYIRIYYRIAPALLLISSLLYMADVQSANPASDGMKTISGAIR